MTIDASRGLPSVSVPVLSTTTVSTFSITSMASAFLIRTPAIAPRPVPTMIDIGVARPRAHRAGDDQHRHGIDERVGHPRLGTERRPGDEREDGHEDDDGHEVARDDVGQALDRGLRPLGLADHPHDLREHRLRPHALGPHHETARAVDGAADETIAGRLLDRDRLARHHRLVDRALALGHDAVDRHLLAGPDAEAVSHPDLLERDVLLAAVIGEPPGRLRGEAEQGLDGARGLAPGPQLQHLPEQHQRGDDGGGLEVHRDVAHVVAERGREDARGRASPPRCRRKPRRCRGRSA